MSEYKQHKAPRVTLQPNVEKVIEAISFVLHTAAERAIILSQYFIGKTLFLADRAHLNKYGRPITFDNYVAMKDGPVPSLAYDLLKENPAKLQKYHIKALPWKKSKRDSHSIYALKSTYHDNGILSDSDKQALSDALTIANSLTYPQLRRLTHDDPAYSEAWIDEGTAKSYAISYGMLFESPNFEAAETVQFLSKHQ